MLRRHGGSACHVHPVFFRQRQIGSKAFDSVHQLAAERCGRPHQKQEKRIGEHDATDSRQRQRLGVMRHIQQDLCGDAADG